MNKGVEASETEVRAELAKQGGKSAAGTEYTLRQIVFTVSNAANPANLSARASQAEQLRARFTDCESGVPLARALDDVAVRDPLTRTSVQLGQGVTQLLDKTPVGHLTAPQRAGNGLEMIAVCSKGLAKDDSAARAAISAKILASRLQADAERRLKEMRSRAVIVKR
jgi:peptidyl-prolyl cis-trans isomerase SurA